MGFTAHKTMRKRVYSSSGPQHGHVLEWIQEILGLLCNVAFVIGSVCFFSASETVFAVGCWLFIGGSAVSSILTGHQLYEQLHVMNHHTPLLDKERNEVLETLMFVISSFVFTVGCILFLPSDAMELFEESTGLGATLSIIGSFLLVAAAHFNALSFSADKTDSQKHGVHPRQQGLTKALKQIGLGCTLAGAVLFTCGSFMYRPDFDGICIEDGPDKVDSPDKVCAKVADYGTLLYLIGSILFLVQSMMSLSCLYIKQTASDGADAGKGEAQKLVQGQSSGPGKAWRP
mmetsp:Transcript_40655/g.73228  ORF Transcript_40655/g.73228 Transcript_40655/m.73228 type:complete len:288 (+) Transcript_40655:70-933(+)